MYLVIYSKEFKNILAKTSGNQTFKKYCREFTQDFKETLDSLYLDNVPENYKDCKIINSELIKMTDDEIEEIRKHHRLLTEEERIIESIKPSLKEVRKAVRTLEYLDLMEEVM